MAIEKPLPKQISNNEICPKLINLNNFMWNDMDEPHIKRAAEILKAHPEIKDLFGYDPSTKYVTLLLVLAQFSLMAWVCNQSFLVMLLVIFIIGAPLSHSCSMAIHEITHGLACDKISHNYLLAIFANLPVGVPSAMSFKKYHFEHHLYQGIDGVDSDIGTHFEANIFHSNSKIRKFFFVFFLVLFYAIRPLIIRPRPLTKWEMLNIVVQVSAMALVVYIFGKWALIYLLLSTFIGMGIHPVAGHLLHEHFVTTPGQETYSHYGIFNLFNFNVGHHNEHHDFPQIPGSRLPLVRKIAPEFYENLQAYDSTFMAIYNFIMTDGFGHYNKIKRTKEDHVKARRAWYASRAQKVEDEFENFYNADNETPQA